MGTRSPKAGLVDLETLGDFPLLFFHGELIRLAHPALHLPKLYCLLLQPLSLHVTQLMCRERFLFHHFFAVDIHRGGSWLRQWVEPQPMLLLL